MSINRNEVRVCVIQSLHEVLREKNVEDIDDGMPPIKDLGLKSLDGIEYACVFGEKFNCHIPLKLNPFVDDGRNRDRTVGQIVNFMCDILEKQEAMHG